MPTLIDSHELGKRLNISRKTITTYIKGGMPCIRLSPRALRFDYEEVVEWLKHKSN